MARTYLEILDPYRLEAIEKSVDQFIRGDVPTHDGRFAPSAAELHRNVKQWHDALEYRDEVRNALPLPSGILSVDFGKGRIDMTQFSIEEQDEILRTHGLPTKRLGAGTAKLQRMTDKSRGFSVGDKEDAA